MNKLTVFVALAVIGMVVCVPAKNRLKRQADESDDNGDTANDGSQETFTLPTNGTVPANQTSPFDPTDSSDSDPNMVDPNHVKLAPRRT